MKERPILFSAPMVRAILEGRKTQTRRLVNEADILGVRKLLPGELQSVGAISGDNAAGELRAYLSKYPVVSLGVAKCPYGVPGDRLWVRERYAFFNRYGAQLSARDASSRPHKVTTVYAADPEPHLYETDVPKPAAENGLAVSDGCCWYEAQNIAWRRSIHLPRWASRITLDITEIRVQRLQDISEDDVWKEGVDRSRWRYDIDGECWPASDSQARQWFRPIWESIHGHDSWELNPWVWAISFNRVEVSE